MANANQFISRNLHTQKPNPKIEREQVEGTSLRVSRGRESETRVCAKYVVRW